jgi:hypothetical protein
LAGGLAAMNIKTFDVALLCTPLMLCACGEQIYTSDDSYTVFVRDTAVVQVSTFLESPPEETTVSIIMTVEPQNEPDAVDIFLNEDEPIKSAEPIVLDSLFACSSDCEDVQEITITNPAAEETIEVLIKSSVGAYSYTNSGVVVTVAISEEQ